MTYMEVENPIREMSTKRIGEKLHPDLQFIKTDFLSKWLNTSMNTKDIIVGWGDKAVSKHDVEKFKENGGRYMFAKNLNYPEDDCVKCFPQGLEDEFKWYNFDKFDLIRKLREKFNGNIDDSKIYLNFSLRTNKTQRTLCLNTFNEKTNAFIDPHILEKTQVSHFSIEATQNFYENILRHRFAASPNGNGIDCQRTYEILLLGRIPVCTRSHVTQSEFARNLPILVLDSWDEFDVKSKEFLDNYDESRYDFSVLSEDWWLNYINQVIS